MVGEARYGIESAVREAELAGRMDQLLVTVMQVARDTVPSLHTSVLIDHFAADARDEATAATAAGQVNADHPWLNHVDRARAAKCWVGYLTNDPDAASEAVDRALRMAYVVGRHDYAVLALLSVAFRLVPDLKSSALSERFHTVSTAAALDEANLLAGEGGPW